MAHLVIWIHIVTLFVGIGVFFDTLHFSKKYHYPFLRPMLAGYVFLNLSFLTTLVTSYLFTNYFENVTLLKSSLFIEMIDPLAGIFYILLFYFILVLKLTFQNQKPPIYLKWLFIGLIGFFIFKALITLWVTQPFIISRIINAINLGIQFSTFIGTLIVLALFGFLSHRLVDKELHWTVKILGLTYLSGCVLILFSAIFAGYLHRLFLALICLVFNIFPFIWYRRYLPGINNVLPSLIAENDLHLIWDKYGISVRQREIIDLIIQGKSNKDIAGKLFIAPHTVKNHIYSLYQKLGVKSRYELINMILEYSKK